MSAPAITISRFRQVVWRYYRKSMRDLPWRRDLSPYAVHVSEIMLQQTQVDRVTPKFIAFVEQFPNYKALANASLREVLIMWQGLGYNRRARSLQQAAQVVMEKFGGTLPQTPEELDALPGIGTYTANAIAAFAYNQPVVMIETNIRTVFLHHYFPGKQNVKDQALLPLIQAALPPKRAREWYWALMDYGSYLKKRFPNPSRQSAHHVKQSAFTNSTRQIRGAIIKVLTETPTVTQVTLLRCLPYEPARIAASIQQLQSEGMINKVGRRYRLPT